MCAGASAFLYWGLLLWYPRPDERLIQNDDMADCVFFLTMGVVLSRAQVHVEGMAVGEDAIYLCRHRLIFCCLAFNSCRCGC